MGTEELIRSEDKLVTKKLGVYRLPCSIKTVKIEGIVQIFFPFPPLSMRGELLSNAHISRRVEKDWDRIVLPA